MIENVSDLLSIVVTVLFVLAGIYLLFAVSNQHYIADLKKREDRYYHLLDEIDDEEDTGEDDNKPYYE